MVIGVPDPNQPRPAPSELAVIAQMSGVHTGFQAIHVNPKDRRDTNQPPTEPPSGLAIPANNPKAEEAKSDARK